MTFLPPFEDVVCTNILCGEKSTAVRPSVGGKVVCPFCGFKTASFDMWLDPKNLLFERFKEMEKQWESGENEAIVRYDSPFHVTHDADTASKLMMKTDLAIMIGELVRLSEQIRTIRDQVMSLQSEVDQAGMEKKE